MHSRARPRIEVDYPATFTSDQLSGSGTLKNLTISGAEIQSQADLAIGSRLALSIHASGARPPIVITIAVVRWKHNDRFGLEFVRFDGRSKQQLEDMLNPHDSSSPR
ncbi:MAG: PilZ domain-containing protein [Nitrospiraceae bacterium]|nr:PilZ domain-containing protein [Nitrospiraceae bacterium]